MEFWLSRSLFTRTFLFHDGILAIKEPFTRTFSFSRWNSGYQGAFHMNIFFLTMEFWLSRSLSHELFLFHDGILAIKKPFTRTFSFSWWNSGYQGAFHTNFFFFTMEFSECMIWGKTPFIYIYHKEYLHRIHLIKNLASWFRAPFARKRVRSFLL
jgi:hypothetical protein